MPLREPLICPILVGRAEFMTALDAILKDAAGGSGRVVLVSGEAGIGKSRLLMELRDRSEKNGWLVLQGNCFEQDRALPYSAWTDLLRRALAGGHKQEIVRALGRGGAEIVRLLPELAGVLPEKQAAPIVDAQQEKQRLFREFERLVEVLSDSAPCALLIEDAHWADESTLELLLHLARKAGAGRRVLVTTYRTDEVSAPLGALLSELDRGRLAIELALDRLDPAEAHDMVRAILGPGQAMRPEFARTLYDLTEGNPFFIEEALSSGRAYATGVVPFELGIPRTVQEAVRRRFRALSDRTRRVAEYAAVAGRRFDFAVLRKICGLADDELLQVMKELVSAQLIVEESADQFAFRHALTRAAIYSALLARERRLLHGQIAAALEELNEQTPERVAGDLGYHFFEAEGYAKSLYYAGLAGAEAQRMYAPRSAVEHLTRAIASAERLGQSPPAGLLRGRGSAYDAIGESDKALADLERALAVAYEQGDRQGQWQALIDLGMFWSARDYSKTGELYKQAFALAQDVGDGSLVAHSMNRLGNWHLNVEEPVEALHYHRQALQLFQGLDDKQGIAATLDLLGMSSYLGGDLVQGLAYYQQAVPLLRELGDRAGLISVLATLTLYTSANYSTQTMVAAQFSFAEAMAANQEALRTAREVGWSAAESYALWNLASPLEGQGRFAEAIESARAGLAIADEIGHSQWQAAGNAFLGEVYLGLLDLERAEHHLNAALRLSEQLGSMNWVRQTSGLLASTLVEAGQLERAAELLAPMVESGMPARTVGERLVWFAAAELALARAKAGDALVILERLKSFTASDDKGPPGARLALLSGTILRAAGKPAEAVRIMETAIENAAAHGNVSVLWRLLIEAGKAYLELGSADEADDRFERAAGVVAGLLANVPAEWRAKFVAGVAARLPAGKGVQFKQRTQPLQDQGGLTPRETTIAVLVARGLSNRAIADQLVLSERTVETHVSNILSKLGFASRAQIAAWAVESKLADLAR